MCVCVCVCVKENEGNIKRQSEREEFEKENRSSIVLAIVNCFTDASTQKEVVEETEMMIPDTSKRLKNSVEQLEEFLVSSPARFGYRVERRCQHAQLFSFKQDKNKSELEGNELLPKAEELVSQLVEELGME